MNMNLEERAIDAIEKIAEKKIDEKVPIDFVSMVSEQYEMLKDLSDLSRKLKTEKSQQTIKIKIVISRLFQF